VNLRHGTRGGSVSEHSGKSETEMAIESFVERINEIHPDLDREGFHDAISEYVQQAVADSGDES
jgi:hypothetical protein